jgi:hypothetical protein
MGLQSCPLPPSTRPETVKQDVPAKRAPGLGDDVCKDAVQHVSEDAEPAPAITVVSVGVEETPVQPTRSTVQSFARRRSRPCIRRSSRSVCCAEVVAAAEALVLDALALPQGTIRQLM